MPTFGSASEAQLKTCHPQLQKVLREAIKSCRGASSPLVFQLAGRTLAAAALVVASFAVWAHAPNPRHTPAFFQHIAGVVGVSTQEQVIRPYAQGIVAGMTHEHPRGDFAVGIGVREPMRENVEPSLDEEVSVPRTRGASRPKPAAIALLHLRPEPLTGGSGDVLTFHARNLPRQIASHNA
jgi:hypothetical protein